jgi:hypothetical protein
VSWDELDETAAFQILEAGADIGDHIGHGRFILLAQNCGNLRDVPGSITDRQNLVSRLIQDENAFRKKENGLARNLIVLSSNLWCELRAAFLVVVSLHW